MSVLNLLVVDDEPGIRSGVSRVLKNFTVGYPFMDEDFSFHILEAETGEQALEIIKSQPVDIVLLDNKLPGIEGIDVLSYIRNNNLDIAVMMITSYASLELAIKATQQGAYNFVPKPFTPQELRMSVENITKHLFLRRMTQKMTNATRQAKFQFLSVLSHELKSPINAIEGYLKMMKDKQLGNDIDDYMEMIHRSMERLKGMRNLITDLLDLTRIESGAKARNILKNDLTDIIKNVVDMHQPLADQKNVTIELHLPQTCYYDCDKNEMEIIFSNLISNAIKYNVENGKVMITLQIVDKNIHISVQDTGIGMNEEEISMLFQEFVRIRNEKTKYITGSGLGLSIVKKMIQLYNGEITVQSKPNEGSIFTVQLPFMPAKEK